MSIAQIYLMYFDKLTQAERNVCTTSSFAKGTEPKFNSLDDFKEWAKDIIEEMEDN